VMVANVVQQQVPIIFVLGTKTIELLQTIWVTLHLWRTFTGCGMFIMRNQYFSYAQLLILRFTETFVSYVMFSFFFLLMCHFKLNPFEIFCSECGWRKTSASSTCQDPCVICLEVECTVAAEGTEKNDLWCIVQPYKYIEQLHFK
jgi:hypothetical protein